MPPPPRNQEPEHYVDKTRSGSGVYNPLTKDKIRLAKIASASSEEQDVRCQLFHVQRDSPGEYQALSYAWGPPKELGKGVVYIDAVPLPVTRTMELALRKLRRKEGQPDLVIWIDALCIDQEKPLEKQEQVENMRTVYENAREVSMWLGPEDWSVDSNLAWRLIKELDQCDNDLVALRDLIERHTEREFQALKSFFRRDYFWRIWVVQEVACAMQRVPWKATVYYESDSMPWWRLVGICDKLSTATEDLRRLIFHDQPTSIFSLMTGGPKNLIMPKEARTESGAPPLLDLLIKHMSKYSSLPHDKVYGIVGISADRFEYGKLDYSRSVRDTFIHTTHFIITRNRRLEFICMNQNDDNKYNTPSWVIDLERRNVFPKHRVVGLRSRENPSFTASIGSTAEFSFSHNNQVLTAAGFIIDTISTVSEPFYLEGEESDVEPTLEIFHKWWTFFSAHLGSDPESLNLFQRTFCGGSWAPAYSQGDFQENQSQRLTLFFGLMQRLLPDLMRGKYPVQLSATTDFVEDHSLEKRQRAMVSSAALRMHAKRIAISENKFACLAPQKAEKGDMIVVLFGCNFPVVLREVDGRYELIGEIYVDGIMTGQAMDGLKSGRYKERKFEIH